MSGYQPLERPLPQHQQQQQVQMQPIGQQPSFNPNAAQPNYARVPTATPVQVYAYPMLPPQQQQWQYAPVVAQAPQRVQQQPQPHAPPQPQLQQVPVPRVYEHPYAIQVSADQPGCPPVGQPGHLSRGKWSDGFCDCCDSVSICLTTCVLAPVRWAQTAERLKFRSFISALFLYGIPWVLSFMLWFISPHRRHRGDGDDDTWDDDNGDEQSGSSTSSSSGTGSSDSSSGSMHHSSVNGLVVVLIVVAIICNIITIVLGARYRGRIRKQFDIPGSACGDCMAHTCFPCCAISQEARHVDRDLAYPL
jgi:Cys-rich protein (TIGR01571 family)